MDTEKTATFTSLLRVFLGALGASFLWSSVLLLMTLRGTGIDVSFDAIKSELVRHYTLFLMIFLLYIDVIIDAYLLGNSDGLFSRSKIARAVFACFGIMAVGLCVAANISEEWLTSLPNWLIFTMIALIWLIRLLSYLKLENFVMLKNFLSFKAQ